MIDKEKSNYSRRLNVIEQQQVLLLYRHNIPAAKVAEYFEVTGSAIYWQYKKYRDAGIKQDLSPTTETVINDILLKADLT